MFEIPEKEGQRKLAARAVLLSVTVTQAESQWNGAGGLMLYCIASDLEVRKGCNGQFRWPRRRPGAKRPVCKAQRAKCLACAGWCAKRPARVGVRCTKRPVGETSGWNRPCARVRFAKRLVGEEQ